MQIKLSPIFVVAAIFFGVGAAVAIYLLYMRTPGRIDFFFRGARYNEIVKAIKTLPLPEGTAQSFQIDQDLHPSSIKPWVDDVGSNRSSRSSINVERTRQGGYLIELITVNDGHYGFGGYVFWDMALANDELPPQPKREPGHIFKKLNRHWFAFHNHES